jgi:hypothetical protein
VGDLEALPAPQAAALAAALSLGPPQPGDRLAVCVAALGLLRAAGRTRPVVAVVDDLQWLDAPSRECVLYAARRAAGPVVFALAVRDQGDGGGDHEDLPELRLGRLGRPAHRHARPPVPARPRRAPRTLSRRRRWTSRN